jgi:hypothetical protein
MPQRQFLQMSVNTGQYPFQSRVNYFTAVKELHDYFAKRHMA